MSSYNEILWNFCMEGKIEPYDDVLITRLRDKYYEGIPLAITLNSKICCNRYCHWMAFQLTRGMDHFRLVRGNVNKYPIEEDANHSWVEKDGWVYDTTDGFKWKKEIYYEMFDATVLDEYDENTYMDYLFYRKELEKTEVDVTKEQTAAMIELIEYLETETPHINHERLLYEINLYREKENIVERMQEKDLNKYKKIVLEMVENRKEL